MLIQINPQDDLLEYVSDSKQWLIYTLYHPFSTYLIILPEKSNRLLAHWATCYLLWELLQFGVNIYYQPPPFAHSKLLLVDDDYAHIGSANLDPRSLRLNFEIVVEIFDREFVTMMYGHFDQIKK